MPKISISGFLARSARFPLGSPAAWRAAPKDLARVLSRRYSRVVARDNTVRLGPRWLQLPGRRSYAGRRVEVRERAERLREIGRRPFAFCSSPLSAKEVMAMIGV